MTLTKHENQTFANQTIYISGQAFVNCKFVGCTLVLKQAVYHLQGCSFQHCNWHIDWILMWGVSDSIGDVKALVDMIEKAQKDDPNLKPPATEKA